MPTVKVAGAGARQSKYWLLDEDGYPSGDQSGANGYDGVRLNFLKSAALTIPDVQPIVHTGDDRAFAQDFLPPTALPTGTLTTGGSNLESDTELTNTLVEDLGDIAIQGMATDQQGNEVDVCLFLTRQALDTDPASPTKGLRRWLTYVMPKTRIIPKGGSMEENSADPNSYNVIPTNSNKKPWGVAFTTEDNGFTESPLLRMISPNPPTMERWNGNGTIDEFNLTNTPISVAKTHFFSNGTPVTVASVDAGAKTATLQSAPANNAVVIAVYEHADGI